MVKHAIESLESSLSLGESLTKNLIGELSLPSNGTIHIRFCI